MITAVDSSILIDVLKKDPKFWEASLQILHKARVQGIIIACPIVWAEVAAFFEDARQMQSAFTEAGISSDNFNPDCAELAGKLWRKYRQQGGKREHIVADFLIAAHAQVRCGRLLTRDRGFYRRYFQELQIIEP